MSPASFLKRMQHVNRIRKCGDVDYPEHSAKIVYPNLPHTHPDGGHRLPVIRMEAALKPVDLVSRCSSAPTGNDRIAVSESPRNSTGFIGNMIYQYRYSRCNSQSHKFRLCIPIVGINL